MTRSFDSMSWLWSTQPQVLSGDATSPADFYSESAYLNCDTHPPLDLARLINHDIWNIFTFRRYWRIHDDISKGEIRLLCNLTRVKVVWEGWMSDDGWFTDQLWSGLRVSGAWDPTLLRLSRIRSQSTLDTGASALTHVEVPREQIWGRKMNSKCMLVLAREWAPVMLAR